MISEVGLVGFALTLVGDVEVGFQYLWVALGAVITWFVQVI